MKSILLVSTFATDVALKQSLGEHIFWSLWYMALVIGAGFVINYIRKKKQRDDLGTIVIISMLTLINFIGMIGHLASLKHFF